LRPVAAYLRSLDTRLPREVSVLELGALVNAFGNGVVLPLLLIYSPPESTSRARPPRSRASRGCRNGCGGPRARNR